MERFVGCNGWRKICGVAYPAGLLSSPRADQHLVLPSWFTQVRIVVEAQTGLRIKDVVAARGRQFNLFAIADSPAMAGQNRCRWIHCWSCLKHYLYCCCVLSVAVTRLRLNVKPSFQYYRVWLRSACDVLRRNRRQMSLPFIWWCWQFWWCRFIYGRTSK